MLPPDPPPRRGRPRQERTWSSRMFVRVEGGTPEAVAAAAKEDGRTVPDVLRELIADYLKR